MSKSKKNSIKESSYMVFPGELEIPIDNTLKNIFKIRFKLWEDLYKIYTKYEFKERELEDTISLIKENKIYLEKYLEEQKKVILDLIKEFFKLKKASSSFLNTLTKYEKDLFLDIKKNKLIIKIVGKM